MQKQYARSLTAGLPGYTIKPDGQTREGYDQDASDVATIDVDMPDREVWTLFPRPYTVRAQPERFHTDRGRNALLKQIHATYGADCVVQIVGRRVRVVHDDAIEEFESPTSLPP